MGMSLYDALEDSALHKATLRQGPEHEIILTVSDQAPHLPKKSYPDHFLIEWRKLDRILFSWKLTVLYRYRVEWWDEGYEHYRSVVFADNFSALTSPLSPASTIGDWQPVFASNKEK